MCEKKYLNKYIATFCKTFRCKIIQQTFISIETVFLVIITAKKMKFSIKDFFGRCHQIRMKLGIWSHLLKKSLMETSFFVRCV